MAPSIVACISPSGVSSPPHLSTNCALLGTTRVVAVGGSPLAHRLADRSPSGEPEGLRPISSLRRDDASFEAAAGEACGVDVGVEPLEPLDAAAAAEACGLRRVPAQDGNSTSPHAVGLICTWAKVRVRVRVRLGVTSPHAVALICTLR